MGSRGSSKHGDKSFDRILGIGIPDLLMNFMSYHGFLKSIDSVFILKSPRSIMKYYFSKVFTILECNVNNLVKLPNDVKQITHSEEIDNSYKVMTCINTIPSTSKKLKNSVVNKILHSSYIQTYLNDKKEMIINIFSAYVVPMLKISIIIHCFKNGKLILIMQSMKKILMLKCLTLLIKNKFIVIIATCTGQP